MSLVDVDNVSKTFVRSGPWPWSRREDVRALRGVSMRIAPGEVVALVGQSGSGKTTLARCILGLEHPTQGRISVDGHTWAELTPGARRTLRLGFQYVPQDAMSALDPQQTVMEHLMETLQVLAGQDRETAAARATALLERLGLSHRGHALPRELSGGEQRRVTLARVFALSPRLVVADEPTSGLDADLQEAVLRDMIDNLPAGASCLIVTHDMPVVRRWCSRALVMLEGEVVEELILPQGTPTHPYAQRLFDPWASEERR